MRLQTLSLSLSLSLSHAHVRAHTHRLYDITGDPNTHFSMFLYFLQSVVTWQIQEHVKWEVSFVLSVEKPQLKACNPVSTPHILLEVYPFDCIIIARRNVYSWVQILWIAMLVVNKIFSLQFSFNTIISIRRVTLNLHHMHTWFNTVKLFMMWNKFIYFFQYESRLHELWLPLSCSIMNM